MHLPKEIISYILSFVPPRHVSKQDLRTFLKKKYANEILSMAKICHAMYKTIPEHEWKDKYIHPNNISFIRSRSTHKTVWSGRVYYDDITSISAKYKKGDSLLLVGPFIDHKSIPHNEEVLDECFEIFMDREILPKDPMGFCKLRCVEFFNG
jgi:hypothetical protein